MKKGKEWRKGCRYFLLFSLLGSLLVACSGASSAKIDAANQARSEGEGEEAKTGKTFTVGFDQEFPPMGFVDKDGSYTGYDLALAKEVAKRLNFTFVPKPINWDAKDLELNSGNIDCIWNGFTMEDREDKYTFVGPYMANRQVFVVGESSNIKNLSDLKGKTVEVQKDSSGLNALSREENKAMKDGFASLVEVGDYQTAMMDLESGACDAICMDSVVAEYQIKNSKKPFAILKDSLSEEDGTVDRITEKWFGSKDGFVLE